MFESEVRFFTTQTILLSKTKKQYSSMSSPLKNTTENMNANGNSLIRIMKCMLRMT